MNNIHIPPVVKNLLIINVIIFAAMFMFRDHQGNYLLVEKLSVFYFDSPFFKIWQPITYMFMHSHRLYPYFLQYVCLVYVWRSTRIQMGRKTIHEFLSDHRFRCFGIAMGRSGF